MFFPIFIHYDMEEVIDQSIPVNNSLLTGSVPVNNSLLTGSVPVMSFLLPGTMKIYSFHIALFLTLFIRGVGGGRSSTRKSREIRYFLPL